MSKVKIKPADTQPERTVRAGDWFADVDTGELYLVVQAGPGQAKVIHVEQGDANRLNDQPLSKQGSAYKLPYDEVIKVIRGQFRVSHRIVPVDVEITWTQQ